MNVRNVEELRRKTRTKSTHSLAENQQENYKTERTAGHLWILILLSTLYRIKLYIIVQILQLEQSVTCVQQNSKISHS